MGLAPLCFSCCLSGLSSRQSSLFLFLSAFGGFGFFLHLFHIQQPEVRKDPFQRSPFPFSLTSQVNGGETRNVLTYLPGPGCFSPFALLFFFLNWHPLVQIKATQDRLCLALSRQLFSLAFIFILSTKRDFFSSPPVCPPGLDPIYSSALSPLLIYTTLSSRSSALFLSFPFSLPLSFA